MSPPIVVLIVGGVIVLIATFVVSRRERGKR